MMKLMMRPNKMYFLAPLNFAKYSRRRRDIPLEKLSFPSAAAVPRSGPRVSGAAPRYSVGDSVSLNCTSNSSDPLAELSWYINSESVRRV